jgi:hypothetical protein
MSGFELLNHGGLPVTILAVHDWDRWLDEWQHQLLERYDPTKADAFRDPLVTGEVLASRRLAMPGATEAQVAALEARLGARLPPSYRSFLLSANGFLQPGIIVPRLLGTDEVSWLRDVDPETIAAWTAGVDLDPESSAPDTFERSLPHTLRVSARETIGTAMYLLNPDVIDADGEWEAWFFAHWSPGVSRYPSFRALMQQEQKDFFAPPPPPPSRAQTMRDALRWIFRPPR